jgi:hypothetical protein
MAIKGFFELSYTVVTEKRRNFNLAQIDAGLRTTDAINDPAQATAHETVDLVQGEWVTLNASGDVIKHAGGASRLAWPVYAASTRYDVAMAGITVLMGDLVATTSMFDPNGTYAAGTELTLADLAGQTVLVDAGIGDFVFAHAEDAPQANPSFTDGLLPISTTNANYIKTS